MASSDTAGTVSTEVNTVPSLWCCDFELTGPGTFWGPTPARGQEAARVLVRYHGHPMGYLTLPMEGAHPDGQLCRAAAIAQLGAAIDAHQMADGLLRFDHRGDDADEVQSPLSATAGAPCPGAVPSGESFSVVVCTRDRGEGLRDCLQMLRKLTYRDLEIMIVDNAPSDDRTRQIVAEVAAQDDRFRYVLEPQPGLSYARNRGLKEARGRFLAYTDDDVMVDPGWIEGLAQGFKRSSSVGCVTGLVCTAAITNASEAYFDARSPSWSARFEPELFDMKDNRRDGALYPYSSGIFGTGANCAFDRAMFGSVGLFDEALGAGSRTKGGEDLDMFLRVLLAGRAIAYEPSAIVWHHHRADPDGLLRQMFGYGSGLAAFLTKCVSHRDTRVDVLRRVIPGVARLFAIKSKTDARLAGRTAAPPGALRREVAGYVCGPVLYFQALRSVRRLATRGSGSIGHP